MGLAKPVMLGPIVAAFSGAIVRIWFPLSWKPLFAEGGLTVLVYAVLGWLRRSRQPSPAAGVV
jgi:hypothetical protein